MKIFRLIAALLCALLLAAPASAAGTSGVSVGYFHGSGAAARDYTPADIPAGLLTHINYAFAQIDPDSGTVYLPQPERDLENLAGLRELREDNPDLKLVISVGGWDGSLYFSDAAVSAESRERFAQSCLDLVLTQDLDGVDIDWEYPVSGGPKGMVHRQEDRQNFTLMLRAIREKLDRQEALTGREYFLTVAGGDSSSFLNKIEPKAVAEVTDYIFIMGYDYCGSWSEHTEFNAPLNRVRRCAEAYIKAGVPAEKLVLGMPLYGRRFQGVGSSNYGLNSTFSKTSSAAYDTILQNYMSNTAYSIHRDSTAASPYLFGDGTFIAYDDPESIAAKTSMAKDLGMTGIGFWEISQNKSGTLIRTAWDVFTGSTEDGFSDVVPGSWYADAVAQAVDAGWMAGTANRVFAPEAPVTRGTVAAALHAMAGESAAADARFSDMPADHPLAGAAAWCAKAGVITGFADGTFRPDASITREQLAAMLFRYAQYKGDRAQAGSGLSGFQDANQVSAYAREAMAWAVEAELLQGRSGGLLAPKGTASRGETAVILSRLAQRV